MNVNPLDRAPTLPPGVKPRTFPEMYEAVLATFREAAACPEDVPPEVYDNSLQGRAWRAVAHLMDSGYLEWWGMKEGLPTFIPVTNKKQSDQVVVLIWSR